MEVGELSAVSVDEILEHQESECPFCKDNTPPENAVSNADPSPDDDSGLIGNDSGELDTNMAAAGSPRPASWLIDTAAIGGTEPNHRVVPNPHHIIPGNESLKQSPSILEWIFESKGKIKSDIGYDVNCAENGIWLPSNNGMRGNSLWADPVFKGKYVIKAMDAAGGHFHDRHNNPYSQSVTKILNKIADRMNGIESRSSCPYKTESGDGRFRPPYALVGRLKGVSGRVMNYLNNAAEPQGSFYTSKLVVVYWSAKEVS